MDVVFFGSGPVAAESLRLLNQDLNIEAVITKPRPPHHKGTTPVLDLAEELGLKIFTAADKKELSKLMLDKPVISSIAVLIDFGIIVSQDVIDYFPKGIVNSHFSLLPKWRGADPISFSILSGEPKTGVSLMLIDAGMDTGKIIAQKSLQLKPGHDGKTLTRDLISLSHELLTEKLPLYNSGVIRPREQPHPDRASYSRKLTKADGLIDWSNPAEQIDREIRAFIEWPKSRASLGSVDAIITKAYVEPSATGEPGHIEIKDRGLYVACGQGSLKIERLKPAGKKEMDSQSFLAGYKDKL
jgi:methionyl-tRNA formyltransferase